MKVYLVEDATHGRGCEVVVGIFSRRDEALAMATKEDVFVTEFELDSTEGGEWLNPTPPLHYVSEEVVEADGSSSVVTRVITHEEWERLQGTPAPR